MTAAKMQGDSFSSGFEWLRYVATIITPIALFILGLLVANRQRVIQEIRDQNIKLRNDFEEHARECKKDLQAILTQMVEYPRRAEILDASRIERAEIHQALREIRQEIRERRLPYDPNR